MEDLEKRQLLAAGGIGTIPTSLDQFDGPRNIGTVASFPVTEREQVGEIGENDDFDNAELVQLGTSPGKRDTIDLSGTASIDTASNLFTTDIDVYRLELDPGDVLDIATTGSVSTFNVFREVVDSRGITRRQFWFGQDPFLPGGGPDSLYPSQSPLQTFGNAFSAQVVPGQDVDPATGKVVVYIQVAAENNIVGNYTLGLRAYRPVSESLPVGQSQIVFLDFDGGIFARDEFNSSTAAPPLPVGGVFRFTDLELTLEQAGVQLPNDGGATYERFVTNFIEDVSEQFAFIGQDATNGDFSQTGQAGDYGITILNSFEHADPGNRPDVTRVVFGNSTDFPELVLPPIVGISQTVDIGNFGMDDIVLTYVDISILDAQAIPRAASLSELDVVAKRLAVTASHELGHSFGLQHTNPDNLTHSIIDTGGAASPENRYGVGPDGILGTIDDVVVKFRDDLIDTAAAFQVGTQFSTESLAYSLSTGVIGVGAGGSITGTAFIDANADGTFTGDVGLAGVTAFLDINGNGVRDANEPSEVTGADGSFSLAAAPGTYSLVVTAPANFNAPSGVFGVTQTLTQQVSIGAGGGGNFNFGFTQINPDATGRVYQDLNSNNVSDSTEPGVPGVFVFADLDGDGQPDLGEPSAVTGDDGFYSLDLVNTGGSYRIRHVELPGFESTAPGLNGYLVNFTGGPLTQAYNFGGRSSRDYGDAPDSYQTTFSNNGASHGITDGLSIGAFVDAEPDAIASTNATGDDISGIDDEEGFAVELSPAPGGTGTFRITLTNSTSSNAFLHGWIDLNADGDFNDTVLGTSEKFIDGSLLGTGSHSIPISLPLGLNLNADGTPDDVLSTFVRLRYSQTPQLGPSGPAATGEVEDHVVQIREDSNLLSPDFLTVARNDRDAELNVLGNDFNTPSNPLELNAASLLTNSVTLDRVSFAGLDDADLARAGLQFGDTFTTVGSVRVGLNSVGETVVFYTPPLNFVGRDHFAYEVTDPAAGFGAEPVRTLVTVDVSFRTSSPIALDDIYQIPSNESDVPLNVLDNDIASISGGLSIAGVMPGNQGGTVRLGAGNQSVRYTPAAGFLGAEQFTYMLRDADNNISTATVTVVLNPQALQDDLAAFTVKLVDDGGRELPSVELGQEFDLVVSVEDISRADGVLPQGLFSAFTDLLYTSELVSLVDENPNDSVPFTIDFGDKFVTPTPQEIFQVGENLTPGLINEIGSTQPISNVDSAADLRNLASHEDATELFRIRMQATNVGKAIFQTDPTEALTSETVLLDESLSLTALNFDQIRFGSLEVDIVPVENGVDPPTAVDDAFELAASGTTTLNVLLNDLLQPGDQIIEFGIFENPSARDATVRVDNRGTVNDFSDDRIIYDPGLGNNSPVFDEFRYILTVNNPDIGNFSSIATVSLTNPLLLNEQASFEFELVNEAGAPINSVSVGDRFGIRVDANDLVGDPGIERTLFAGFLDILYDANVIAPANTTNPPPAGSGEYDFTADDFNFDVIFDSQFNLQAAVGTNNTPGLIDEFGSLLADTTFVNDNPTARDANLMATIFFDAIAPGPASVVGAPADNFPFQDTLIFGSDTPVPVSEINYGRRTFTVNANGAGGEPLQNTAMPADVNNDNAVSAIDALIIINELTNQDASGEFAANTATQQYFHDVNGDGRVSAVDALNVINWLNNRPSTSGSGEEIAAAGSSASDEAISQDVAASAEDLSSVDKATSSETSSGEVSVEIVTGSQVDPNDSTEDDDWLNLLADDVTDQWS